MHPASRRSFLVLWCALSSVYGGSAVAQVYPSKPVRIIVPFPPGGVTDVVARILAARLSDHLGQQVVVENRAGGASTIGMGAVAKSAPDGYTLGVANLTFSINPILFKRMPYDSDRDLSLVSHIA